MNKEMMKGSTDILLLSLINQSDMYGYEIIQKIKLNSDDLYKMSEGTLYPALNRLKKKGWITSYWDEREQYGRRKYYSITEEGKKELELKLMDWSKVYQLVVKCSGGMAT
ncbi:PadR family transcriptional regulator [Bacillus cereus]|uniref:PadR family transcriptional regulator n=1 Tax=Bacillus cereus TaxID=1396 RepID=UPI0010BD9D56|nr:PadR family transcriptional regulator [Bacillus cereus]TKH56361.1 PadR family transcriptional regulator [Bacillus cereus]